MHNARTQDHSTLPAARSAGVCLHLTSLPGPYGIGEIGDRALAFVDTLKSMDLKVWQFLPTGPTAYGDSPYQPLSSFAGNQLLVDMDDLVRLGLLSAHDVHGLTILSQDYVDYGELIPRKMALLHQAGERFAHRVNGELRREFEDYVAQNDDDWLHDYALFRVIKAKHGERAWPEWDKDFVHREPATIAQVEKREATNINCIKVVQFLFQRQWIKVRDYAHNEGISLFGDMPIYIALDSADAWSHREILRIDDDGQPSHVAGVPPDYFSADGQFWGNPLYNWEYQAANKYDWWVDRIRHAVQIVDMIKVDHFRGFEAYWSIPVDAETAREGRWEPGPNDALFDAMREALGSLPIIAEDLGVITPEVEALRDRHQIPGMNVLQFDVDDEEFEVTAIQENRVCYTGTHDNDTTAGWFKGSPMETRTSEEILKTQEAALAATHGQPETIHNDLIRLAFSTAARLAMAPMQDFLGLGSQARMNTPGNPQNNWRWRLQPHQITTNLCESVRDMVKTSGRD